MKLKYQKISLIHKAQEGGAGSSKSSPGGDSFNLKLKKKDANMVSL